MFGRRTIAALEARLAHLEARQAAAPECSELQAIGASVAAQADRLTATEQGLNIVRLDHDAHLQDLSAALGAVERAIESVRTAHAEQLQDHERWLASMIQVVGSLSNTQIIASPELQALGPQARRVDPDIPRDRALMVWAVVRWLAQAPIESDALISVIMPTRNRRAYLARAIESVLAQRHSALELVIVDDGSTDGTDELLASLRDPRIRSLRATGIGVSGARNLALQAASGTFVAYLDDDNIMDPLWLRGVAWAFARWSDKDVLYGARIVEDAPARNRMPSGAMPGLEWWPYDRDQLEHANTIDMNVLAHRAGLKEARFDESLRASTDWDILLRLTAHAAPLELPVIACLYSNYAHDRISDSAAALGGNRLVRARVHTTRPMRVWCCGAAVPPPANSTIEEEMLTLQAQGARVAFAAFAGSALPDDAGQPIHADLDNGIASLNPDVVVVYWTPQAGAEIEHLALAGRPFALRVHSIDCDADAVERARDHPLCVGVWALPHHAAALPAPVYDPAPGRRFHQELSDAITAWRMQRQLA